MSPGTTDFDLGDLFHHLDNDKNGEISSEDFLNSVGGEHTSPKISELVEAIIKKEPEIFNFKKNRLMKLRQSQCEKAFLLLDFNGTEPIIREDFSEIVRACGLIKETSDVAAAQLFTQLDADRNGEISSTDFLKSIVGDDRNLEFLNTVLAHEQDILAYKLNRRKAQKQGLHFFLLLIVNVYLDKAKKAFSILAENGIEPLNKQNLIELVRACSLTTGTTDFDLADLFAALDNDKDSGISQEDFLKSVGGDYTDPKLHELLDNILSKEPEILAFKKDRAKKLREGKVFPL